MTKQEAIRIFKILKTAYPRYYLAMDTSEIDDFTDLLTGIFEDKPIELVLAAVKSCILGDDSGFPPDIGKINKKIFGLCNPDNMSAEQAWQLIEKAVCNSGYHAKEEFAKLEPTLQQIVGSPRALYEWSMMNIRDFKTTVRSDFICKYKNKLKDDMVKQTEKSELAKKSPV